jgi:Flp pilus assembly protein TadD
MVLNPASENPLIARLEQAIATGRDTALARFTLGRNRLTTGDVEAAILHLSRAITLKPDYSAAYRMLGAAYARDGQTQQAQTTWEAGCSAALAQGELQAHREMVSLLRKLRRLSADQPCGK